MPRPQIDYSVYLVTGRELLPPGKDYYESLEESLKGGVTVVQVREKTAETGEFIEITRKTKALCDKYGVPVLVNDRVDVALAAGVAGIHIGQDDMDPVTARKLIGEDAILGLSVSTVEEAERAIKLPEGVLDYVGVGAVWSTASKDVSKKVMLGPSGAGEILDVIADSGLGSVAIGGINARNTPFLLHGSVSPEKGNSFDGVAVISAIVSSSDPEAAARQLSDQVASFKRANSYDMPPFSPFAPSGGDVLGSMLETVGELIHTVRKTTPLVHQITNSVVVNDSANVTLAVGASPIMATNERDCTDLSKNIGSLLINSGTITDETFKGMLAAGSAANVNGKPVVWDPVAVGATAFRRETGHDLLHAFQPTVIKGNAAEIGALANSTEVSARGVDSVGRLSDPAALVRKLAKERQCIIVMTGVQDYISNGTTVLRCSNGHPLLGLITGSGCMTGSIVACFLAAARTWFLQRVGDMGRQEEGFDENGWESQSQLTQGNMLIGALAGVLTFNIAAEQAAKRPDVKGPGTFRAALIDEMYAVSAAEVCQFAKVEILS